MKKLEKMMQEGINENDLKKVAWALNLGLNINGVLNDGMPSLHWAVRVGNVVIAKFLISLGADVKAKDDSANTPLAWAVSYGKIELAKLLISAGADVNIKWGHYTLLHWAVSYNLLEITKLLIDSGADVKAKGSKGEMILNWARSQKMQDLLKKHGAIV
jgi:ankyrin repeat protein